MVSPQCHAEFLPQPWCCVLLAFGHHLMAPHRLTDRGKTGKGIPNIVWQREKQRISLNPPQLPRQSEVCVSEPYPASQPSAGTNSCRSWDREGTHIQQGQKYSPSWVLTVHGIMSYRKNLLMDHPDLLGKALMEPCT